MNGEKPKTVDFHYKKTETYRTYHVDGAFGGTTPKGNIYVELFVERFPTPQIITQEISPEGVLGSETGRTGKEGIIREIECGLVLDLQTAVILNKWIGERIKELMSRKLPNASNEKAGN